MNESLTWIVFDIMGTVAFALSGTMVGILKRMDIFGISVLSVLTAIGGGIIRDILLGITPPSALTNVTNLFLALGVTMVVCVSYRFVRITAKQKRYLNYVFQFSDTVGLASFSVTGALRGFDVGSGAVLPVILGVITAVGGGVLRDLMAVRMPTVLYADVYAMASIVGGTTLCLVYPIWGIEISAWTGFAVTMLLRLCAIKYRWQIYHPHSVHFKNKHGDK